MDAEARRKVYASAAWKRLRRSVLAGEPLCRNCLGAGRVQAGREVDHVRPMAWGGAPFARSNLQVLCRPCHSRKTRLEAQINGMPAICTHGWPEKECGICEKEA